MKQEEEVENGVFLKKERRWKPRCSVMQELYLIMDGIV